MRNKVKLTPEQMLKIMKAGMIKVIKDLPKGFADKTYGTIKVHDFGRKLD